MQKISITFYLYQTANPIRCNQEYLNISSFDNATIDVSGLKTEKELFRFRNFNHIFDYIKLNLTDASFLYRSQNNIFKFVLTFPQWKNFLENFQLVMLLNSLINVVFLRMRYNTMFLRLEQVLSLITHELSGTTLINSICLEQQKRLFFYSLFQGVKVPFLRDYQMLEHLLMKRAGRFLLHLLKKSFSVVRH